MLLTSDPTAKEETGFVPESFLIPAPPDGTMLAEFRGETPGEASLAADGGKVWALWKGNGSGWIPAFVEPGSRGMVPEAFVSWSPPP